MYKCNAHIQVHNKHVYISSVQTQQVSQVLNPNPKRLSAPREKNLQKQGTLINFSYTVNLLPTHKERKHSFLFLL